MLRIKLMHIRPSPFAVARTIGGVRYVILRISYSIIACSRSRAHCISHVCGPLPSGLFLAQVPHLRKTLISPNEWVAVVALRQENDETLGIGLGGAQ